ncbi:reverse transcriptase domain-containing protein [Tanacetum coccineum]
MARKSMSQTEQQEYKVAENASNKRKWEGNHNGSSSQQNKGHKLPRAHTTWPFNKKAYAGTLPLCNRNPAAARNQRTHTCYECGSLRHFKSECLIVKFQKRVDKKISTLAERQAENKRKLNNTSNNNQNQQQPNKRQNTGKAYTTGHGEKKHYGGSKLLCSKCNYHHDGPCAPKCHKCNRVGHLARNCRSSINANAVNNQRVTGNKKEHEEHLKAILELLKKEELYAKFSKCEFWILKVQFLGHVIDSEGFYVDPAKIESIKD